MAEHIEVARAFVTIVPSMEGSQAEITKELTGATNEAAKTAGSESGGTFGTNFASAIKGATAAIGAAMAAATGAAVATGKAFLDSAKEVADYGNTVDKASQKMGISAQAYQEWDFIMQHAGTSIDGMKTSMLKLTKAAEAGDEAFDALGISQDQLAKMSQEDIFSATIEALQGVQDEGQRTVLANKLLGKGATELAPLFNMTAEETEALKTQVHELGGVMSDEAVKNSAAFSDSMQNMKVSLDGIKMQLMSEFLPGLTTVMDGLTMIFSGDEGGIGKVQEGLQSVIANITYYAPQFMKLAQSLITSLMNGFAPMLPQLATTIFSVINKGIVTVTGMLPQLLPVITTGIKSILKSIFECLPIITKSLFDLVKDLAVWLSEGDNITTFINGIIELVSLIAGQMAETLPVLLPAIIGIIGDVANCLAEPKNVMMILGAVFDIVTAVVKALWESAPKILDFATGVIKNLSDYLTNFLKWITPYLVEGLTKIIGKIKEWGGKVKDFITGLITSVKDKFSTWIENLKTSFANGFEAIKTKISDTIEKIKNFVSDCIDKIKSLPDKAMSIGKDFLTGLWNGISDKTQWILDKIKGIGSKITDKVKSVFGIASPSKVFAEIGGFLAEGLGVGFEDEIGDVTDDMANSMNGLTASMNGTVQAVGTVGASDLTGSTVNYGGNTINVYAAEGQNVDELAEIISIKLEQMTRRKGAVYA